MNASVCTLECRLENMSNGKSKQFPLQMKQSDGAVCSSLNADLRGTATFPFSALFILIQCRDLSSQDILLKLWFSNCTLLLSDLSDPAFRTLCYRSQLDISFLTRPMNEAAIFYSLIYFLKGKVLLAVTVLNYTIKVQSVFYNLFSCVDLLVEQLLQVSNFTVINSSSYFCLKIDCTGS